MDSKGIPISYTQDIGNLICKKKFLYGGMAKLAYAPDLGSGGAIRAGSTPVTPTNTL